MALLGLAKFLVAGAAAAAWLPQPAPRRAAVRAAVGTHDEQQMDYMRRERCILVDRDDRVLGAGSKVDTHLVRHGPPLHRAFSVFLFDSRGRMLLQRRAAEKITFPSHWTNTCCSHPLHLPEELGADASPADAALLGARRAAVRKLGHELGIPAEQLPLSSLAYMGRIHYIAASDAEWGEHEIDYIFFVQADVELAPNPNEVREVAYLAADEVAELFSTADERGVQVTPWARHIVEQFVFEWWEDLGDAEALARHADATTIHRMGECAREGWVDPSADLVAAD